MRAGLEVLRGDYQRTETELTARRFAADETLAALTDGNRERGEDSACLNLEVSFKISYIVQLIYTHRRGGLKKLCWPTATGAQQRLRLPGAGGEMCASVSVGRQCESLIDFAVWNCKTLTVWRSWWQTRQQWHCTAMSRHFPPWSRVGDRIDSSCIYRCD